MNNDFDKVNVQKINNSELKGTFIRVTFKVVFFSQWTFKVFFLLLKLSNTVLQFTEDILINKQVFNLTLSMKKRPKSGIISTNHAFK